MPGKQAGDEGRDGEGTNRGGDLGLADLPNAARSDRLLLGSKWRHAGRGPEPANFVTETLEGIPNQDVQPIARDDAASLLGLSLA